MKKVLALAVVALLAFSSPALAGLSAEVEADIQFEKDMTVEIGGQEMEVELESQTYMAGVKLTIGDLQVTPLIGVWDSEINADSISIENTAGLALGFNAEYALTSVDMVDLSLIGGYRFGDAEIDEVVINNTSVSMPLKSDVKLHEYELGIKATANLDLNMKPYVAVVWSDTLIDIDVEGFGTGLDADLDADKNLGIRLGLVGNPTERLAISIEGKLIDEKALIATVKYGW